MKAVAFETYGGSDVLRVVDLPSPVPGPTELLVRVHAAGVNPADWKLRSGRFRRLFRLSLPFVPGMDIAGEVVSVGAGVRGFSIGNRVFAMLPMKAGGGYAQEAVVEAALAAHAPKTLSLAEASAIPLAGLTAYQGLHRHGAIAAGQAVLINGASGGVGAFAVQIARAAGASVTAITSTQNLDFARDLGADSVLDYRVDDVFRGPRRFDLVFDTIAKASFRRWRDVLRPSGTVVSVNPVIGKIVPSFVARMLGIKRLRSMFTEPSANDLQALARLVDAGSVRVPIQRTYAFDDVIAAHEHSASERVRGKLVIGMELRDVGFTPTVRTRAANLRTGDARPDSSESCARIP
jgi:NADPH:quinone reductase-like Zn-dependent oxidoreductase